MQNGRRVFGSEKKGVGSLWGTGARGLIAGAAGSRLFRMCSRYLVPASGTPFTYSV